MERHQQTLWLNPGSRILASTRRKRKDKNKEKLQSIDVYNKVNPIHPIQE